MSNKNGNDDLIGFKDFLEDQRKTDARQTTRQRNDGFELLTFLEQDSQRIENLIKIFEEKSYVLKNYPQSRSLLSEISTHRELLKKKLLQTLSRKDSALFTNLGDLFNEHYQA